MLRPIQRTAIALIVQAVALGLMPLSALAAVFRLEEATITDINKAFDAGALNAQQLVQLYLNRIEAYDDQGPSLNAVLALNPKALETAAALDLERQLNGPRSPLHGIPVLLKDNYDTFDLPTTAGSLSLEGSIPPDDAFQVKTLRAAGAIILGKTNLHEFARGGTTISSLGGQTLNPYDTTRIPGGSSGGAGAAIAANFAVLGTGSDTGGSIRMPSSINNLVGIRPTLGLTSGDGIVPLNLNRDTGGPMARTITDMALMLDVLAGYDPADPATAASIGKIPPSYTDFLNPDGLENSRIGVLTAFVEDETVTPEVLQLTRAAIDDMEALGAEIVESVTIPDLSNFLRSLSDDRFKYDINNYLASLGPDAPVESLAEIIDSGKYTPSLDESLRLSQEKTVPPEEDPGYYEFLQLRQDLQTATLAVMAENNLDALVYPTLRRPPDLIETGPGPSAFDNQSLSPRLAWPAITVPAGFTADGLPVGVELLGRAWSEPTLFQFAYAYEQATMHRRPPASTPPLPGEEFEYATVPEPSTVIGLGIAGLAALGLKRKQHRNAINRFDRQC